MELPREVTNSFESDLVEALQPIRGYVLASVLYAFFQSGLYNELSERPSGCPADLAAQLSLDPSRTVAVLKYLRNEGYLLERSGQFSLSHRSELLSYYQPWYTMLIGGYSATFNGILEQLRSPSQYAIRDAAMVGIGSCGISHFDAIPLFRALLESMDRECRRVVDLGCGDALCLIELCTTWKDVEAWGVEPDERAFAHGREAIRQAGLENRIQLVCADAIEFLSAPSAFEPDCFLFGFMLQELLEQVGEDAALGILRTIGEKFPDAYLSVIEVDYQIDSPIMRSHQLGISYYNPYFLIHAVTQQRLERAEYWRNFFRKGGYDIVTESHPSCLVDSTGLEIGFLLKQNTINVGRVKQCRVLDDVPQEFSGIGNS
jgi:2-ketoarginine methyltransferase